MRTVATLACATVVGLGLGACGGDDESSIELPRGAVAVAGDRTIAKRDLQAEVATVRRTLPRKSRTRRRDIERQALTALLEREWLEQEARERGITVSAAEVRRRWQEAARAQFPNARARRRFLGARNESDVLAQLRLQTISERIEADVRRDAEGNRDAAVRRFRDEMARRQRDATVCRADLRVPACGEIVR